VTEAVAAQTGVLKLRGQSKIGVIQRLTGATLDIGCARCWPHMAVAAMLMVGLTGCGSISDRTAAAAFTSPGKYDVYSCEDVERMIAGVRVRQVELEQLMARASQGAGGEFVNTIAYRGEYAQGRGDLIELVKAKADKQCVADSKYSSGRAIF
jgi:hypothetical protein